MPITFMSMKKYSIASMVFIAALSFAAAEEKVTTTSVRAVPAMMIRGEAMMAQPLPLMTGDKVTDEKIKALQTEMEAKIKAIREEYQAKIKAVIGDKKLLAPRGGMMATTTSGTGTRMMMREVRQEIRDDAKANGENVGYGMRNDRANENMENHEGMGMPKGPQVRGAMTDEGEGEGQGIIRAFFGRLFGR